MAVPEMTSQEVARPLRVLVPLIKEELYAGQAAGLEHYRRAGEMLREAKEQVGHGGWGAWLKRNFHLSDRTAHRYMLLARKEEAHNSTPASERYATLSEATDVPRPHHQPAWHKPVQQTTARMNLDRLIQERQGREAERQLVRKLAVQIVDIGYKVLATKLHPDKGGSSEGMARLVRARDMLRGAI